MFIAFIPPREQDQRYKPSTPPSQRTPTGTQVASQHCPILLTGKNPGANILVPLVPNLTFLLYFRFGLMIIEAIALIF